MPRAKSGASRRCRIQALAFFAFAANYLIHLDHPVIVDVEGATAVRPAEVAAAMTMIEVR